MNRNEEIQQKIREMIKGLSLYRDDKEVTQFGCAAVIVKGDKVFVMRAIVTDNMPVMIRILNMTTRGIPEDEIKEDLTGTLRETN